MDKSLNKKNQIRFVHIFIGAGIGAFTSILPATAIFAYDMVTGWRGGADIGLGLLYMFLPLYSVAFMALGYFIGEIRVRIYNRKTMRDKRKIFIIPVSIAFFVLITLDSFASADYDESIVIQKACGISGLVCSNKSFESKQIERFFTKVSRKNDDLSLKTLSGPPIILSNKKANQEGRKVYWFLTYFQQIKYFFVQVRGWEGTSYLIINASTGDIHSLLGIPIISKNLKRFAVASLDLEAGYIPNRISIYQFFDNSIKKEWSKDFTASGPSDVKWINNTAITFFENFSKDGGQTIDKKIVTIKLLNGEWEILSGGN